MRMTNASSSFAAERLPLLFSFRKLTRTGSIKSPTLLLDSVRGLSECRDG